MDIKSIQYHSDTLTATLCTSLFFDIFFLTPVIVIEMDNLRILNGEKNEYQQKHNFSENICV